MVDVPDGAACVEFDMEVDEAALGERDGESAVLDKEVRLLAKDNRFTLSLGPVEPDAGAPAGSVVLEIPLRCVGHPHPECELHWLSVSLSVRPGRVLDLSPGSEVADQPVKVVRKRTGGLSFDKTVTKLAPEIARERSTEQDVYFPTLQASGKDMQLAKWTFERAGETPLRADRELSVLAGFADTGVPEDLQVTLRAKVTVRGWQGTIPLLGKRKVAFNPRLKLSGSSD
ncbi:MULTISPECIES: hypothetical protein [Kitasatospora]|uniref:Uncharacterized protein n=1 Tax=Kitasatospora cathayae TaxID=3004092 RepID=A0ABY7QDZ3_9ACTN|nr:hypothetical protein [Kitasatospora sp. HUAS 3-15]WBP90321.1 hypothetical protein O1G21_33660 [Kitasatospora sp. HUAS 3-15]